MKRNLGLALVALILMALSFLLLPTSMAKRNENSKRDRLQSGATTAKLPADPNRFKIPGEAQPGAPISMEAAGFAESIPVREMVSARGRNTKERGRQFERDEEAAEGRKARRTKRTGKSFAASMRVCALPIRPFRQPTLLVKNGVFLLPRYYLHRSLISTASHQPTPLWLDKGSCPGH